MISPFDFSYFVLYLLKPKMKCICFHGIFGERLQLIKYFIQLIQI